MSYKYQTFPFGKYKGIEITDIPISYVVYALQEFDLPYELKIVLKNRIFIELEINNPFEKGYPSIDESVVNKTYKSLAKKYHPDKGGSDEAMKALNEFKNDLIAHLTDFNNIFN